jgi:uncharacterized membrane protein HdeD (DUF308 family)
MSVSPHATTTSIEPATVEWWLFVVWGAASVVVGALLLFQPVASALVLVATIAVFWVVGGIVDIISGLTHHGQHAGWRIAAGVLNVVVGLFVLSHPFIGTLTAVSTLYLIIAASALVSGIVGIFNSDRSISRIVLSLLQAGLAILMLIGFADLLNLRILVQSIGLLMIAGGIAAASAAFHFRHHEVASL